jgi:hypothetical protein
MAAIRPSAGVVPETVGRPGGRRPAWARPARAPGGIDPKRGLDAGIRVSARLHLPLQGPTAASPLFEMLAIGVRFRVWAASPGGRDMDRRRKPRSRKPVARLFDRSRFDPAMVKSDGRPSLVEELTTYRDRLPELLRHERAYVIIKGQEYKILPDREAALESALKRYWPEPALVQKIVAKQPFGTLGGAVL